MKAALLGVFILLASGGSEPGPTPLMKDLPPVEKIRAGFVYVGPVGDAGWTYAHDQGRKTMAELPFVEATRYVENVPEASDATRVLTKFANLGFNLIFTTSYGYMEQTMKAASRFPRIVFEHCSGNKVASNMGM